MLDKEKMIKEADGAGICPHSPEFQAGPGENTGVNLVHFPIGLVQAFGVDVEDAPDSGQQ